VSRGGKTKLTLEDRILWAKVARTATPLPGHELEAELVQALEDERRPVQAEATPAQQQPAMPGRAPGVAAQAPGTRRIDEPVRKKLQKGRLPIEGRIDLHGLSQGEAHGLLLGFLHRAHSEGRRHLLVVTGKGSSPGSEGVLRRVVPAWFSTPAFRGLVHSHSDAGRRHGGEGALYVTLRRRGGGS
jgi:DNA-nicking Smr family endonuclease